MLTESSVGTESYLDVLNPEQKEAVLHEGSSLLILAGAGSGKTRVITTKIAWLIKEKHVDPYAILAVTFTKKAAAEMKERAIALEPRSQYAQIRTFHSWGAYFLRRYALEAGISSSFTVYDDDDMVTLLTRAVPTLSRQQASQAAHHIALAKDYCLEPESEELYTVTEDPSFPSIYKQYQERLKQTGNVDFGDLIMLPYLVLRDNENIRERIHTQYRVIMVDEYQDSNVAQFKLLRELSGVEEDSGIYVCVVGDDDQSIYRFRGAEVQNILNFQSQFPGTALIRLQTNYRSTSKILACADNVVRHNESRLGKTLVAARGDGKTPTLVFLPNQEDETQFCREIIVQAHKKGVPYKDWAILYRTNAQSLGFETEFLHAKIPYTIVGSLKFYEREEVKDALAWIAFVANPRDEVAFRRVVNKPAQGVGNTSQDKILQDSLSRGVPITQSCTEVKLSKKAADGAKRFAVLAKEFSDLLPEGESKSGDKLSVFIDAVVEKSGLEDYHKAKDDVSGTQKLANLQELVNSAVLYPCTKQGLLDFLDHVQLDRTLENSEDDDGEKDSVTLITLHNTKGLEFPRVIITGMESGIFPREDKSETEIEEERRLFYVGITRAKNELYFTCCSFRRLYGQTKYMSPSPFLSEIGAERLRILGEKPLSFAAGAGADSLSKKYHVGAGVYHDDYGHGQIVKIEYTADGELIVSVRFETATDSGSPIKKFLPKYQSRALMLEEQ